MTSSSSVNSLNSSFNLNQEKDKLNPILTSSHSNLMSSSNNNNNNNANYPFNRTLLNANSFVEIQHNQYNSHSNKSSLQRNNNSNKNNNVHGMNSDLFNNTTSNMSSPPSVEFIKNPMRSSFENLSDATNNTNSQSQLVSILQN